MKIDELQLIAFGPFTGTVLDLSGGQEGFHLIYGPNEAGKSSALRALRYLLYGIPTRSADNFIHPYPKLRIGATLRASNGHVLKFIRRKGRINTLRGPDDTTLLDEALLQKFISHIDADLFGIMFGIGYEDLVRGGQDIIRGGGDVGRLVFSAGSGIANLLEIQNDLQTEADQLFRPTGQKQIINEALARLNQTRINLKFAQLKGQDWAKHDKALQKATEHKKKVQAELDRHQKQLNRFQRIQQALPLIAERKDHEKDMKEYENAILLPETFPEQRRELLTKVATLESQKDQSLKNIESGGQAISELVVTPGLIDHGETIEDIHLELGSQKKAARDRIQLETRRSGLLAEAREILKNLGDNLTLENAEKLRIKKHEAQRIRQLGSEYERIMARIENARERVPEIHRELAQNEEKIDGCPFPRSTEQLHSALAEAEDFGPQESQVKSEQIEMKSTHETVRIEQIRLRLQEKSFQEIESLQVPSIETHRIFESGLEGSYHRIKEIQNEFRKIHNRLAEVKQKIETICLEQEVPSEEDLQNARNLRDTGWNLIQEILKNQAPSSGKIQKYLEKSFDCRTLEEAFDKNIRRADLISDRLRREADRVATKAMLLTEQNSLKDQQQKLEKDLQDAENEKTRLTKKWTSLWDSLGLEPLSPKEMIPWSKDFGLLAEKLKNLRIRQNKTEALQKEIDIQRLKLIQYLQEFDNPSHNPTDSLGLLIKKARSVIAFEDQLFRKKELLVQEKNKLENELKAARERLQNSEKDLNQWQQRWASAIRFIGLDADAHPEEANVVIDEIKNLFDKLKEAKILEKRIMGIDRDAEAFESKVGELVKVVATDLSGRPAGEAALELHHRLKKSRETHTKTETLEKQLEQEKQHLNLAMEKISILNNQLKSMCVEARCDHVDQLPETERRSSKRREISIRLESIDKQLRRLSGGVAVDDFILETQKVDPDGISGEIQALEETIDKLNSEKSNLDQTIGSEKKELSLMDGSGKAAELAEEIQIILGGIETDAEHYARLKIATRVLSMAIERYRDKSQGPILKRASELFNHITHQAFQCIRAEYDDMGQPVIVGVRQKNSEIVRVENMSDGTADQLYLALRLAGLEMYLENNEPIPFIVDDILIKFDNDRAAATLRTLAHLSEKTQLLFFTHHHHLVELARRHIDPSMLFQHNLE